MALPHPLRLATFAFLVHFALLQRPDPAHAQAATRPSRPNIILIVADDLGWGELGCYGNTFNETPHLDRLARQGMRFTQAYAAAPTCSPTRASILTGQYPPRTGITDFLSPRTGQFLDPARYVTLNEALAQTGYHTGQIGKWHLDTNFKDNPGGPRRHGFHEVIGTETEYIADGDYFYPYQKIATFKTGDADEYLTDRLSDEAVDFIRRACERRPDQPFFLYLTYYAPHTALDAPPALVAKYRAKHAARHGERSVERFDERGNRAHLGKPDNPYLAAMIERIDAGVGRIMACLGEMGISDDTVVIFISDNGGDGRVANNGNLRAAKTHLWEGGIRVPHIVRWPGVVPAGSDCEVPVSTIDLFPTLAHAAGAELPEAQVVDGVSLISLLNGQADGFEREALFWHYPADTVPWPERAGGAIRLGDFKLVEMYEDGRVGLFNLKEDPGETRDLTLRMPGKAAQMHKLLAEWRDEVTGPTATPQRLR